MKITQMNTTSAAVLLLIFSIAQIDAALYRSCTETSDPAADSLSFMIALRNQRMSIILEALNSVSNPSSSEYGNFWDWREIVRTTSDDIARREVMDFLTAHKADIESASADGQWLRIKMVRQDIEAAFSCRIVRHQCKANDASEFVDRAVPVSGPPVVPSQLSKHVDLILGLWDLPISREEPQPVFQSLGSAFSAAPSSWPPGPWLTISQIRSFYSVNSQHVVNASTTASVFEINAPYETYNPSDLATFQQLSGLPEQPVSQFAGDPVTTGCPQYTCAEPNLDVEMLMGMAPGVNLTYWTTNVLPVPPAGDVVLQWLINLASTPNPSWIHSISYGPPESHLSAAMLQRMNEEFVKLSLRGITFITSSGDDGVNRRTARGNPSQCGLSPQYPASNPWVTTVGGTMGPEYSISERTCQTNVDGYKTTITSGGGFSIFYDQPDYQTAAVNTYLQWAQAQGVLPPANTFNSSKRAYPDVSLLAHGIDTIINGNFLPLGGTSASAPLFAGMMALILDARLQAGLPPLGPINPLLYKLAANSPDVFNDMIVGDNRCTGVYGASKSYTCCPYGFNATKGWDPVTGLGSVNFDKLKAAFMKIAMD